MERTRKERYELCRREIAERFFEGRDPGEIKKTLETGDRHLRGEAVSRVDTEGGETLYYKPRDCRTSELLGEVNNLLFGRRLVPDQVTGEGFAFQKKEEKRIPKTDEEKAAFYTWMGRLTAVFYALGSVDMHVGNILCCGRVPVVVDTETLLYPIGKGVSGAGEFSVDYGAAFPDYRTSVGECMVLPRFYAGMQRSPLLPGEGCTVEGYEDCFLSGFEEGYRKVCENRESVSRILDRCAAVPLRYLLRSTAVYAAVEMSWRNAETEEARESILKRLEKGLSEEDLRYWKKVLDCERTSIREGNIPIFTVLAGKRDLMADRNGDILIPEFLERSALDYAKWRMERMGEDDLKVQAAYIRANLKHIDGQTYEKGAKIPFQGDVILSAEAALKEVREALDCLWEEKIPLSGGRMLWHVPFVRGRIGSLFGLGEGFSGTAVFLSRCAASPLLDGEAKEKAKEMSAAAFRSMAGFGTYLLDTYPDPPEERVMFRRFDGGFDFPDGLTGFLWAVRQCAAEERETAERLLRGFERWNIDTEDDSLCLWLQEHSKPNPVFRDTLEDGNAGLAAVLLQGASTEGAGALSLEKAGCILSGITERKKETGCWRVYRKGRKQYFLPAFLRGSTGIAWTMLRYAELKLSGDLSS